MRRIRQHFFGVTLIEMMFVVIIIGIAAIYSIGFIREKQRENNVRHTADQMNNILQVGLTYHSRFSQWPLTNTDLINVMGVDNWDFCTVWPGDGTPAVMAGGTSDSTNTSCPHNAVIGVQPIQEDVNTLTISSPETINRTIRTNDPRLFSTLTVNLTLPSNMRDVTTLLHSIAHYLPSAVISGNTLTIYTVAQIALPQEGYPYGYISKAGIKKTGSTINLADKCYTYSDQYNNKITMEKHTFLGFYYGLTDYKQWWTKKRRFSLGATDPHRRARIVYIQSNSNGQCSTEQINQGNCQVTFQDRNNVDHCDDKKLNDGSTPCPDWHLARPRSQNITTPATRYYYFSICLPPSMWQADAVAGFGTGIGSPSQRRSVDTISQYGQCNTNGGWVCGLSGNNDGPTTIYDLLGL